MKKKKVEVYRINNNEEEENEEDFFNTEKEVRSLGDK